MVSFTSLSPTPIIESSNTDDQLSELPDSLIFDIFWLLPIRDVVRTTILSKRWRDLWTTSRFLNLTDDGREGSFGSFRNLMNRAIILWRGDKLLKFKVSLKYELNKTLVSDINVWIRFAKENQVQELCLDLSCSGRCSWPYGHYKTEFENLYSCSSLRVLSIDGHSFFLGLKGNVKWDRLKCLAIHDWKWDQDAITKVLCGSPNLEVFILTFVKVRRGEKCCIQSSSLKKLSFNMFLEYGSELKIRTPNLETLELLGEPYSKLSVGVACLTDVTLGFSCGDKCGNCGEETFEQILPSIQHVEKVLVVMNKKSLFLPLSEIKLLKLIDSDYVRSFSKHEEIALLEIFPKLKMLVIDGNKHFLRSCDDDENEDV